MAIRDRQRTSCGQRSGRVRVVTITWDHRYQFHPVPVDVFPVPVPLQAPGSRRTYFPFCRFFPVDVTHTPQFCHVFYGELFSDGASVSLAGDQCFPPRSKSSVKVAINTAVPPAIPPDRTSGPTGLPQWLGPLPVFSLDKHWTILPLSLLCKTLLVTGVQSQEESREDSQQQTDKEQSQQQQQPIPHGAVDVGSELVSDDADDVHELVFD